MVPSPAGIDSWRQEVEEEKRGWEEEEGEEEEAEGLRWWHTCYLSNTRAICHDTQPLPPTPRQAVTDPDTGNQLASDSDKLLLADAGQLTGDWWFDSWLVKPQLSSAQGV